MLITKKQVLDNLDEVKKFIQEDEQKKEEKTLGIAIKNRFTGSVIFQSTKTTYKDAIIEKGDTDLSGADLSGADLYGANLRDTDLSGANLRDTDLRGADLRDADLSGADLSGADLYGANLRDADLRDAEMMNSKFFGKGGTKKLTKRQLPDFLNALGFQVED